MSYTRVSTPKRLATAAFAGVMALSLMVPSQLAFADFTVGDENYDGTEDKSGEGSEGGTWSYVAEGQQMTLVDYVGGAIIATEQDLNVQLEGDNTITGNLEVDNGNLTITGDDTVYGDDKPSLTMKSLDDTPNAWISSNNEYKQDAETGEWGYDRENSNLTISNVTVTFESERGSVTASGDLTIKDSKIARGDANESLGISAYGNYDPEADESAAANIVFEGSDIEATAVRSSGVLTIDNTDLTVKKPSDWDEDYARAVEDYKTNFDYDYLWVEHAVTATKGIKLKGEDNGKVVEAEDVTGKTYYYLTTGSDDKVELKATYSPAYYTGTKGMPATGDDAMPLVIGASITAALAALAGAYSLRQRKYADLSARK